MSFGVGHRRPAIIPSIFHLSVGSRSSIKGLAGMQKDALLEECKRCATQIAPWNRRSTLRLTEPTFLLIVSDVCSSYLLCATTSLLFMRQALCELRM
jgi:hypothetical protein